MKLESRSLTAEEAAPLFLDIDVELFRKHSKAFLDLMSSRDCFFATLREKQFLDFVVELQLLLAPPLQ